MFAPGLAYPTGLTQVWAGLGAICKCVFEAKERMTANKECADRNAHKKGLYQRNRPLVTIHRTSLKSIILCKLMRGLNCPNLLDHYSSATLSGVR